MADFADFTMGSDHEVYADSSFGIPAIYLNDWPDRYIHTNFDVPANIDPTKLKRAGFIGAASGYFLANVAGEDAIHLLGLISSRGLARAAKLNALQEDLSSEEGANLSRFFSWYENRVVDSMSIFFAVPQNMRDQFSTVFAPQKKAISEMPGPPAAQGDARLVFKRNSEIKGTMGAFGYDYFNDKYGAEKSRSLKLPRFQGLRGSGGEYTYEVLNFVDGQRNVQQIRDAVSAEYGPVPIDIVLEYLRALESIKVITR